ncbi:DUF6326 family protein [Mesobacterium sp. TK19101]|uniref:DUF6326 family protein n=1 Tax=Mesobacterium hydrothermale TaxID=3111907 RepID=A0ABU6HM21_9RHOB|nr:DUF6326 family protein [Mesobacterium sp. TK19101]MEC3862959.1 DUF6326 family protein [Mesobacterium sp. TK19101]
MNTLAARRNALSSLWAFVALNIAFADILGLYTPGVIPEVIDSVIEGVTITQNMMLIAAVFIQIPVAMIVAMQFLRLRAWRTVNISAALVTAVFVVAGGSMKPHYIFFASCEIVALLSIVVLVWRAPTSEWADAESA